MLKSGFQYLDTTKQEICVSFQSKRKCLTVRIRCTILPWYSVIYIVVKAWGWTDIMLVSLSVYISVCINCLSVRQHVHVWRSIMYDLPASMLVRLYIMCVQCRRYHVEASLIYLFNSLLHCVLPCIFYSLIN